MKPGIGIFLACVLYIHLTCSAPGELIENRWPRPHVLSASNDNIPIEYVTNHQTICRLDSSIYEMISSRLIHVTMDKTEYFHGSLRTPLIKNDVLCSKENFNAVNPCAVPANEDSFVITDCYTTSDECICELDLDVQKSWHDVLLVVIAARGSPNGRRMNEGQTTEGQTDVDTINAGSMTMSGDTALAAGSEELTLQDTEKFDPGIITHAVLVVLAVAAFVGNAMFILFVFWLSR